MKNLFYELSSKELRGKAGIYLIKIAIHTYVGSSKSLYDRLNEHRGDLKKNQHSNNVLQRCYNKYNEVYYKILEFCAPDIRIIREKYWIDFLKTDLNQQDPILRTLSKKSKQQISESLKEAYRTGRKIKPIGQPIELYDLEGNFIQEFKDVHEASKETGYSTHMIQVAAARYYSGRTCGFRRFRYKYSKVKPKKFNFTNTNKLISKFTFFIIEPDGTKIKVPMGIKHINETILQQFFKGNFTFTITGIPKSPLNCVNCLETPEEGNQQPS